MRVLFVMCSIYLIGAVVSETPTRDSPIRSPSSRSPSKLDSKSAKRSPSSKSSRFMSMVSGVSSGMGSLSKSNKWFSFNSFKKNPARVVRKALRGDHLDRSPSQMSFSSDIAQESPSRAETQRQILRTAYSEFTKECNEQCSLEWGYHYQSDHESYTNLVFTEGTVIPITKGTTVKTSKVKSGLTGLLQSTGEVMRLIKPAYTCFCMTTKAFQTVLQTTLKTYTSPDEFEKSRNELKTDPEGASKVLAKIYPKGKKGKNFQHVDHETLVKVIVDEMSAHIEDSEFHDSDFEERIAKLGWCDADMDHGLKRSSSRTPPSSQTRPH